MVDGASHNCPIAMNQTKILLVVLSYLLTVIGLSDLLIVQTLFPFTVCLTAL